MNEEEESPVTQKEFHQIFTHEISTSQDSDGKWNIDEIARGGQAIILKGLMRPSQSDEASLPQMTAIKLHRETSGFTDEANALRNLRGLPHVIELRAIRRSWPTTILCQTCGRTLSRFTCPVDSTRLSFATEEKSGRKLLISESRRRYYLDDSQDLIELFADAPCCSGPSLQSIITNPTPAVILELLDGTLLDFGTAIHSRLEALDAVDEDQRDDDRITRLAALHLLLSAAHEVSEAVAESHERGILHLDIQPNNVMYKHFVPQMLEQHPSAWNKIAQEITFKVVDYGIARTTKSPEETRPLVTAYFNAPEKEFRPRLAATWKCVSGKPVRYEVTISAGEGLALEPGDTLETDDGVSGRVEAVDMHDSRSGVRIASVVTSSKAVTTSSGWSGSTTLVRACSEATDIFAIGLVLSWLITGGYRQGFEELHGRKIIPPNKEPGVKSWLGESLHIVENSFPTPSDLDAELRGKVLGVIEKCLRRDANGYCEKRLVYGTLAARRLAKDLEDLATEAMYEVMKLTYGSGKASRSLLEQSNDRVQELALHNKRLKIDLLNEKNVLGLTIAMNARRLRGSWLLSATIAATMTVVVCGLLFNFMYGRAPESQGVPGVPVESGGSSTTGDPPLHEDSTMSGIPEPFRIVRENTTGIDSGEITGDGGDTTPLVLDLPGESMSCGPGFVRVKNFLEPALSFCGQRSKVTVGDYRKCVTEGSCNKPKKSDGVHDEWGDWEIRNKKLYNYSYSDRSTYAINGVSFDDARKYCSHIGASLPSAVQWISLSNVEEGDAVVEGIASVVANEFADGGLDQAVACSRASDESSTDVPVPGEAQCKKVGRKDRSYSTGFRCVKGVSQ